MRKLWKQDFKDWRRLFLCIKNNSAKYIARQCGNEKLSEDLENSVFNAVRILVSCSDFKRVSYTLDLSLRCGSILLPSSAWNSWKGQKNKNVYMLLSLLAMYSIFNNLILALAYKFSLYKSSHWPKENFATLFIKISLNLTD